MATMAGALLLAAHGDALAWGFAAHRMVNARAIETLPEPLRAWYSANAAWVAEHGIDADLERDRSDDPDHFLDFDAFGAYPFPDVGEDEAEHLRRFGAARPSTRADITMPTAETDGGVAASPRRRMCPSSTR